MKYLSTSVESLSREDAARYIFGDDSQMVTHTIELYDDGGVVALSDMPLYQILVLVLLVFYLLWIYRYIIKRGLSTFVGAGSSIKEDKTEGLHSSSRVRVGDIALQWCLIVGIYILFITKVVEVAEGLIFTHFRDFVGDASPVTQHIANVGLDIWMGIILVGIFSSILWSLALLYLSDLIARRRSIYNEILALRGQMLLYSVIFLMPFILLCSFGAYDSVRFYFALILVIIFTFIYLIRSFLLFRSKKISILLWFLYLCAVEIFPATLVWSIFTRS